MWNLINLRDHHEKEIKWKNSTLRNVKNQGAKIAGFFALLFMLAVLVSIFGYILHGGAYHITLRMFTTYGNTTTGGLLNAIIGTWLLVGMGLLFSVPSGVLGALYNVQSTSSTRIRSVTRLFTDILTSVPSIVIGLFGYLVLVIRFDMGFSLLAGGIALGIMMLPYVMRISEISMKNVPQEQVNNAYALGADRIQVASRIYLPQARAGIISGILLAIGIAAGETAQLLYTAGWNNALPSGFMKSQVAYLTYVVWYGINQPSSYAHELAFASALILIIMVTVLISISKFVGRKRM